MIPVFSKEFTGTEGFVIDRSDGSRHPRHTKWFKTYITTIQGILGGSRPISPPFKAYSVVQDLYHHHSRHTRWFKTYITTIQDIIICSRPTPPCTIQHILSCSRPCDHHPLQNCYLFARWESVIRGGYGYVSSLGFLDFLISDEIKY